MGAVFALSKQKQYTHYYMKQGRSQIVSLAANKGSINEWVEFLCNNCDVEVTEHVKENIVYLAAAATYQGGSLKALFYFRRLFERSSWSAVLRWIKDAKSHRVQYSLQQFNKEEILHGITLDEYGYIIEINEHEISLPTSLANALSLYCQIDLQNKVLYFWDQPQFPHEGEMFIEQPSENDCDPERVSSTFAQWRN